MALLSFLGFHGNYDDLAERMVRAVTDHATPVGSATVARTKRIPVEERAEAAVIAWMWHQTTGYDGMAILRIKNKRREVRRMLAARSKELLARYLSGEPVPEGCPLKRALAVSARHEGERTDAGSGQWRIESLGREIEDGPASTNCVANMNR